MLGLMINAANAVCDMQGVDVGLAMLDAGGDFADGVIAYEGLALEAGKAAMAQLKAPDARARALSASLTTRPIRVAVGRRYVAPLHTKFLC